MILVEGQLFIKDCISLVHPLSLLELRVQLLDHLMVFVGQVKVLRGFLPFLDDLVMDLYYSLLFFEFLQDPVLTLDQVVDSVTDDFLLLLDLCE